MCSIPMLYPRKIQAQTKTRAQRLPQKQNDNTCAPVCGEIWYSGICVCIYIYTHMYTMHSMPVVSECKLNQVDIVLVSWRATFNKCPEIPLSASFLPSSLPSFLPSSLSSFLPSLLPSLLPFFGIISFF